MILRVHRTWLAAVVMATLPLWAQNEPSAPIPAVTGQLGTEDRMLIPPPVSGESYSTSIGTEERSNYLRGRISFNTAYSDNVLAQTTGTAVSDVSYSVWPSLEIDKTTSRLHLAFTYAPGFTFYQRTPLSEADHNLSFNVEYRLSPHVTVSARDSFQKSSNVFNQPDQGVAGGVSGSTQGSGDFVFAPIADRLTNTANVGISYQFSPRSMVGMSGDFSNLHYPSPNQVLEQLNDSNSRGASAFYNLRLARKHYVGITYQYEKLQAAPTVAKTDTDAHALLFFYTVYPTTKFSASFFGGPQYTQTSQLSLPASNLTSPAAGASINWHAQRTGLALGYSHMVTGGGGLIGATRSDNASASVRQEITKSLVASVAGSYSNRKVLVILDGFNPSGHSLVASASLEQRIGSHVGIQAGYTRLHQNYSTVPAISFHPDTNREWVGISYDFTKALGR